MMVFILDYNRLQVLQVQSLLGHIKIQTFYNLLGRKYPTRCTWLHGQTNYTSKSREKCSSAQPKNLHGAENCKQFLSIQRNQTYAAESMAASMQEVLASYASYKSQLSTSGLTRIGSRPFMDRHRVASGKNQDCQVLSASNNNKSSSSCGSGLLY